MNAEFYRLLGFLDVVTEMLDAKDLALAGSKQTPQHLQKQLVKARKTLMKETLVLQRATAEFETNVEPVRVLLADAMRLLSDGNKHLAPAVSEHLHKYAQANALGGGGDCSTSLNTSGGSGSSSSSRSSSRSGS